MSIGSVAALIAAVTWWRAHETAALVSAVIAVVLIGSGLAAPTALRVPNRIWWWFAQLVGWVNARIILSAFFFIVLTPAGVLMRTFGRNPLVPAKPDTAWSPYAARRKDPKHYQHPY